MKCKMSTNNPLNNVVWETPLKADTATGKAIQNQIDPNNPLAGVKGMMPGNATGIGCYPTLQLNHVDLTQTPFVNFSLNIDEYWQPTDKEQSRYKEKGDYGCGLSFILLNDKNGWNPSGEDKCDLTQKYNSTLVTLSDGSTMRKGLGVQQFAVDMRTLGVPLTGTIGLCWSIRSGMKGIDTNYQLTDISVSADGTVPPPVITAPPAPVPTPAPAPTPTAPATITLSIASVNGSVSQTLIVGQTYVFSAAPASGYNFSQWLLGNAVIGSAPSVTVTASVAVNGKVLSAVFKKKSLFSR
jgi:hypothetical protein